MRILRLLLMCAITLTGCGRNMQEVVNYPNDGRNMICFGDSITKGQGVGAGDDYPAVLAGAVDRPVINAGVNGNTTANALARIDKDVLQKDPYMVIIELGANDMFQDVPEEKVLDNLALIVKKVQAAGAITVICNVGDGGADQKYDLYSDQMRSIAEYTGSIYVGDLLEGVRQSPELMLDHIHPNDKGYKIIAHKIYKAIKDYL